jgi:hypothetical protein
MTVVDSFTEDHELDDYFNRLIKGFELEELKEKEEHNDSELDWWLEKYPTLEESEEELLRLSNKSKGVSKDDFESIEEYILECISLDHDIMMLEMTVDSHYSGWVPEGAKLDDFKIGTIFRSGGGRFLCTDVGQRTVIAIRYTPRDPKNMDGPPYFLAEHVFAEFDIEGVDILS